MINLLVVTPAFNEAAVLPDFVDALLALRREVSATIDVRALVVDDGSPTVPLTSCDGRQTPIPASSRICL